MTQDKILMQLAESLAAQMEFNRKLINKICEMQTAIDLIAHRCGVSSDDVIIALMNKE